MKKLSKIDPVDLGTYWGAFQCEPRGPLWKIGNFQTERHLLNTYRPADAQVKLAFHVARLAKHLCHRCQTGLKSHVQTCWLSPTTVRQCMGTVNAIVQRLLT